MPEDNAQDLPAKRAPLDYKQEEFVLRRGVPALPKLPGEDWGDYGGRMTEIYYARGDNFKKNKASFTPDEYALEDKILDALHDTLEYIALMKNPDGHACG